jgi:hypothetical protein
MTQVHRHPQRTETEDSFDVCEPRAVAAALLQDTLACLRRYRDTPLQAEDAGLPMSERDFHALALKHLSQELDPRLNALDLRSALNQLVDQLLSDGHSAAAVGCMSAFTAADDAGHRASASDDEIEAALRAWVEGLATALREVHPRALEIVALRSEGFHELDVAQRVSFPLRLVRRIMRDVQTTWRRTRDS